jgi:hypothetical protein
MACLAALPWIGAGATLTLAVGVIVGLVDRLTRQRDRNCRCRWAKPTGACANRP